MKVACGLGPFTLWLHPPLPDPMALRPMGFLQFPEILSSGLGAFVLAIPAV